MPVYLFTFHSHGSWLPDHKQGYTRKKQGVLPADPAMAERYRDNMTTGVVRFDQQTQSTLIAAVQEKADVKGWAAHAIATDPTHAHILLSWSDDTAPLDVRRGLKASITRQLNRAIRKQTWLSQGGSRKPIKDSAHFTHLIRTYLPKHQGQIWIAPQHRAAQAPRGYHPRAKP